ncbi:class I SAM-dependent DNA methyltransferase [Thalassospira lucentensis]|uniref:type I restriction-modification system subunit M n=1 Tax=Thalassospira lucentensis TaxID=168935 RepID=UPI00294354A3|nr:class I SAM-dependent DNA methyltransferase [Thalassospira lucentensis]WOI12643.1 class I SAM-dependent DNA methyltransferase [Thalassospira lucentensis]
MGIARQDLTNFIFEIANKLRGPYRPPQYRKVMLPMTVLRRLDLVLQPSKDNVIAEYERLQASGLEGEALHKVLARKASGGRQQPIYNISPFTFEKMLGDPPNVATNLVSFINGFSQNVRDIFERFEFEAEIEKLDKSNRLFLIIKEFTDPKVRLHPNDLDNADMGDVFEELVRRFNEQANEEAGDHFTPREVIRLMAELVYTEEEDVYKPGIVRTIYDPTCGTGGMLSVSEDVIKKKNTQAYLELFGQEYNAESWAICCSDMLIKDEAVDNIVYDDTLTDDGHSERKFHYMLANPPFGVEWRPQEDFVKKEHEALGFAGRFGPGLPTIRDGATLFLMHMMSKMHPAPRDGGEGSKIAIVFNGSPLFNGDPGPSESNIRRWIIENDWLDAIVALPDQLFYNTGILTYIWLVSNRKPEHRRGKVQLVDASRHFVKMTKSKGDKRNRIAGTEDGDTENQIAEIVRLYGDYTDGDSSRVLVDGKHEDRVCSRIFDNRDFGYLKVTVERPLRLNFQLSKERIEKIKEETAFANLAKSKKKFGSDAYKEEVAAGEERQKAIFDALSASISNQLFKDRDEFTEHLDGVLGDLKPKIPAALTKALVSALSEKDPTANECYIAKRGGERVKEPDPDLRDIELVPLPDDVSLPLPVDYDRDADNSRLLTLVQDHCEDYLAREVTPYVPDAWMDHSKTKVGYEIPINRHFYVYKPPRELSEIEEDIKNLEKDILAQLNKVVS